MLSVCRGPVRCGPAQLEPVFTQPLRPDWEALFSHPGAFQRKPPAEAPRIRYTTLKTIHTASFPPSRSAPRLHTHHIKNTESVWNIPVIAPRGVPATKKVTFSAQARSDRDVFCIYHLRLHRSVEFEFLLLRRVTPSRGCLLQGVKRSQTCSMLLVATLSSVRCIYY